MVDGAMSYIEGRDRSETLLLPAALDDYVGADNAVRLIDAFVDGLDLGDMGFGRVEPKQTGRPGYHPADLLKLYIYGYLNKLRSSRRLEIETHRNLEVIWLLRELRPDFKTIADFRKDNREAFRQVFRAFTILCRDVGLMGKKLLAVDGTRIKAVNNVDRNFTRAKLKRNLQRCDKHIDEYLLELDRYDRQENPGPKIQEKARVARAQLEQANKARARLKYYEAELAASGKDQLSITIRP